MARAKRRPPPPRAVSETDGYDDYRARFAGDGVVSDLGGFGFALVAIATWFALSVFSYYLLVPATETVGNVVLTGLLSYAVIGPLGAAGYWMLVVALTSNFLLRLVAGAIAIAAFLWAVHIW